MANSRRKAQRRGRRLVNPPKLSVKNLYKPALRIGTGLPKAGQTQRRSIPQFRRAKSLPTRAKSSRNVSVLEPAKPVRGYGKVHEVRPARAFHCKPRPTQNKKRKTGSGPSRTFIPWCNRRK